MQCSCREVLFEWSKYHRISFTDFQVTNHPVLHVTWFCKVKGLINIVFGSAYKKSRTLFNILIKVLLQLCCFMFTALEKETGLS